MHATYIHSPGCSHRQVLKAGYLGGPAALHGGSELRGVGRHHGGHAVGPAISTRGPFSDAAASAFLMLLQVFSGCPPLVDLLT